MPSSPAVNIRPPAIGNSPIDAPNSVTISGQRYNYAFNQYTWMAKGQDEVSFQESPDGRLKWQPAK
ncbi:hypothetical protein M1N86_02215 [Dehalococcoidia bacterium]|nr:hypothetical protein [Dehalococcoidia bacterium]